ncbi:MAG: hydrolase [Gammaproteobacteria bacterium CG_4_10_14_0_8_um_filter_38_16]|nr:MAG: hydrolase [Gammaproteobacteria bacterium CG_4_10_14_0_8_um_filter_38_16]PJA03196.1 MAG: hydrolase [Gammaproteobacteria bacterium CG_4_10_14_0_2_um_filter_38_22]PJB10513.1 MAG: hydrolase [Gammaproteobacteria bacterium CG_4_9_14_3_um_filter_38_9]
MQRIGYLFIILFVSLSIASCAHRAITQPVPIAYLAHYRNDPENVKQVISKASALSKEHLGYQFGSDNPATGAMDCSGVIYYLLKEIKDISIPRDSYQMYFWLLRNGKIHYVTNEHFNSYQFHALRPGDLLFWTGTFQTNRRPPITHVMLYLGKNKKGEPLMFGSSNGIYKNKEIFGVSVFNFTLPTKYERDRLVAYGCIPGFTC